MSDIKAIRARLAAATPGPWRLQGEYVCADDGEVDVAETFNLRDRALIAQAPTDLADLCDEVEVWREVGAALGVDGPAAALAEVLRLRALLRWRDGGVPRG